MTKRARVSPEAAASLSWHGGEAPQSAARRWGDAIVSTRPVYLGCVGGEAAMGRQEAKLPHHVHVISVGVMVDDHAVAQLVPMNMLHFEVLVRRRDAYQHSAVDRNPAHTFMSPADSATDHHGSGGACVCWDHGDPPQEVSHRGHEAEPQEDQRIRGALADAGDCVVAGDRL